MDELDLTGAEAKATYKEIQEWVQEKYGFHVTNLNIAQVKQKHGIIERENYNKPKSEDSKQPGCPEGKVKAIEDAMRHFREGEVRNTCVREKSWTLFVCQVVLLNKYAKRDTIYA